MKNESVRTLLFVVAAVAAVFAAVAVQPESYRSDLFSDQGETMFPKFTDIASVKAAEVVDYDETEATARPLKVEFRRGRWILSSHGDYPAEARERLAKTAAALIGLKRDHVVSDRWEDQARYGVVDPLDAKTASLTGRGKRVTLRDARGGVLADLVFGEARKDKPGVRYVRLPGQKRIYAAITDADPSARFEDWVEADLLRVSAAEITKLTLNSYSIDEQFGRLLNVQRIVLVRNGENWNAGAQTAAATLSAMRVVDARAKPKALADQLRSRRVEMSLETVMSMRQRGFFISPMGQILANEGELIAETSKGLLYHLRFGEVAPRGTSEAARAAKGGDDRYLFVTVSARTAEMETQARALDSKFADWYYVIGGSDFARLRPGIKPRLAPEQVKATAPASQRP